MKLLTILTLTLGLVLFGLSSVARAEEGDPGELARALPQARVSLAQGLKASEAQGQPISGKYEIEDDALQLSVYTMKGGAFTEVIVDHATGNIKKAEPITDSDDLKDAKEQAQALARAKTSLETALNSATASNNGYQAVSIVPTVQGDHAVANIALMRRDEVKKLSEPLD